MTIELSYDGAFAEEFGYGGSGLRRRLFAGAPYTIARLIERRFVPTIYFGDLGGAFYSTSVCMSWPT